MPSTKRRPRSIAATTALALAASCGVAMAQQPSHVHGTPPEAIAITGARIITVSGQDIAQGSIVVRNGKIIAVGPADEVELPYDAIEYELEPGTVVMPGMFHPGANNGLAGPNESFPITPFLDIRDAIDPSSLFFESMLRAGITSVHVMPTDNAVIGGLSAVVRPIGRTMGDMEVLGEVALKFSVSPVRGSDRMTQLAQHREVFAAHADYVRKISEEKYENSRAEEEKPVDVPPEEAQKRGLEMLDDHDYDERNRNIMRLLRADFGAWWVCDRAMDIAPALTLAQDNNLTDRSVLIVGTEAFKAAERIAESGRPVVLSEQLFHRERDPITGELNETFVPKAFSDAGVTFALQPSPSGSFAEQYPIYQVAQCIRNGVPRDVAFKAITLHPAQMLGLDDQLGSIEVGKIANLVVLTGDPLDFNSEVDHVFIEGIHAYDRSKDRRLQELRDLRESFSNRAAEDADNAESADENPDTPDENGGEAEAPAEGEKPVAPDARPQSRPDRGAGDPRRQRRGN
ncbi:MAG: amidohydrolase family protein [Phycisphaerales bacterium]